VGYTLNYPFNWEVSNMWTKNSPPCKNGTWLHGIDVKAMQVQEQYKEITKCI
jgi:hypothetical protein